MNEFWRSKEYAQARDSEGTILQHNGRNGLCASTFWLAQKEGFGIFAIAPGEHVDSGFWNETIEFSIDKML